jgi:hypothetical protein
MGMDEVRNAFNRMDQALGQEPRDSPALADSIEAFSTAIKQQIYFPADLPDDIATQNSFAEKILRRILAPDEFRQLIKPVVLDKVVKQGIDHKISVLGDVLALQQGSLEEEQRYFALHRAKLHAQQERFSGSLVKDLPGFLLPEPYGGGSDRSSPLLPQGVEDALQAKIKLETVLMDHKPLFSIMAKVTASWDRHDFIARQATHVREYRAKRNVIKKNKIWLQFEKIKKPLRDVFTRGSNDQVDTILGIRPDDTSGFLSDQDIDTLSANLPHILASYVDNTGDDQLRQPTGSMLNRLCHLLLNTSSEGLNVRRDFINEATKLQHIFPLIKRAFVGSFDDGMPGVALSAAIDAYDPEDPHFLACVKAERVCLEYDVYRASLDTQFEAVSSQKERNETVADANKILGVLPMLETTFSSSFKQKAGKSLKDALGFFNPGSSDTHFLLFGKAKVVVTAYHEFNHSLGIEKREELSALLRESHLAGSDSDASTRQSGPDSGSGSGSGSDASPLPFNRQ